VKLQVEKVYLLKLKSQEEWSEKLLAKKGNIIMSFRQAGWKITY
jgi:hypothetical protein